MLKLQKEYKQISFLQTDIVFRWFLDLGIKDTVPDDTTISHFRVNRLTEDHFEIFFNEIVKRCIEYDLIIDLSLILLTLKPILTILLKRN